MADNHTNSVSWEGFALVEVPDIIDGSKMTILIPAMLKENQEQISSIYSLIKEYSYAIAHPKTQKGMEDFQHQVKAFEASIKGSYIDYMTGYILLVLLKKYEILLNKRPKNDRDIKKAFNDSNKKRMADRISRILDDTLLSLNFHENLLAWITAHQIVLRKLEQKIYNRDFAEEKIMSDRKFELINLYLSDITKKIMLKMESKNMSLQQIELMLGLRAPSNEAQYRRMMSKVEDIVRTSQNGEMISIPSSFLYHTISTFIFSKFNGMRNENGLWPQVQIEDKKKGLFITAMMKPRILKENSNITDEAQLKLSSKMIALIDDMEEYTVDVMNALFSIYFSMDKTEGEWFSIDADKILEFLGKKKKKSRIYNGEELRGGFKDVQRDIIKKQMDILFNLYLYIKETESYGKNKGMKKENKGYLFESQLTTQEIANNYLWTIRPNANIYKSIYGSNSQYEIISKEILRLDSKYSLEKRIGYYFSFLWRVSQKKATYLEPISIKAILAGINWTQYENRPALLLDRITKALNILKKQNIIRYWSVVDNKDNATPDASKNNRDFLNNRKLIVEPPEQIIEHYLKIPRKGRGNRKDDSFDNLSNSIRKIRQNKNYSYSIAAEKIKIKPSVLLKFELQIEQPSPSDYEKIKFWYNNNLKEM